MGVDTAASMSEIPCLRDTPPRAAPWDELNRNGAMKSKRSLRFFSNTLTAAGLVLAVSACSTVYQDDWDQTTDVPDLNQPTQRSEALLAYCKRLHDRGDLNLAAGICNRAHEISPTDPAPLIELARVMEDMEMTQSAEEAYRAALLLDPGHNDALYGLGKIYIDQQRYDLAMEPLQAAAAQDTDDPRIYNALGVIMDQQGQHADAQAYYREGLEHSPRNVSLRNNLGLSMVLDGQPEEGLAMLRDVAAEPAAGATTGRNLEMASQIAAQSVAAKANATMSELESAEPPAQTGMNTPSPHGQPHELASLEPSSATADAAKTPADAPMPLLRPYPQDDMSEAVPDTAPSSTPHPARSLDQELADAMAEEDAAPEADKPMADAAPAADATTDEQSATPRDWSLAAQTVFATSRSTQAETAPAPAEVAESESREDLAIAPASTSDAETQAAALTDSYPIDEGTFYTAQLASFRTAERARAGWQILKESAGDLLGQSDAFIVRADLGAELGIYYRIRAGAMGDQATARQICLDLQAKGVECMPVATSWQETTETLVDKICQTGSTGALCGTADRSDADRAGPPFSRG